MQVSRRPNTLAIVDAHLEMNDLKTKYRAVEAKIEELKQAVDRVCDDLVDRSWFAREGQPIKWNVVQALQARATVSWCTGVFHRIQLEQWMNVIKEQVLGLMKPTQIEVFGRTVTENRLVMGFGEDGVKYTYNRKTIYAEPMVPVLKWIRCVLGRSDICNWADCPPNFILVNYYKDGNNSLGQHSDKETDLVRGKPIVSFSLGAARRFVFHHRNKKDNGGSAVAEVLLRNGTICVMEHGTQQHFKHSIPADASVTDERWNLTFRWVNVKK